MSTDLGWWLDSDRWLRLSDAVSRHFVAIRLDCCLIDQCGAERNLDTVAPHSRYWSCVFVEVRRRFFLLTAAHVVRKDDPILLEDQGFRCIRRTVLAGFGGSDGRPPAQFRLRRLEAQIDPESRDDLAFVSITRRIARAMMGEETVPLPPAQAAIPTDSFDVYGLMGHPDCAMKHGWTGNSRSKQVTTRLERPLLPIVPDEAPDPGLRTRVRDGFFGQILTLRGICAGMESVLEGLEGMSGGPVFGFRLSGGRIDYRLVGVMSHFVRPSFQMVAERSTSLIVEIYRALEDRDRRQDCRLRGLS